MMDYNRRNTTKKTLRMVDFPSEKVTIYETKETIKFKYDGKTYTRKMWWGNYNRRFVKFNGGFVSLSRETVPRVIDMYEEVSVW